MSLYVGQVLKNTVTGEYGIYAGGCDIYDVNGKLFKFSKGDDIFGHWANVPPSAPSKWIQGIWKHAHGNNNNHIVVNSFVSSLSDSLFLGYAEIGPEHPKFEQFVESIKESFAKQAIFDKCGNSRTCKECAIARNRKLNYFVDGIDRVLGNEKFLNLKPESVGSIAHFLTDVEKDLWALHENKFDFGEYTPQNHPSLVLLAQYLNKAVGLPYDESKIEQCKVYLQNFVDQTRACKAKTDDV